MITAGQSVSVTIGGEVAGVLPSNTLAGRVDNLLQGSGQFQVRSIGIDDGGALSNLLSARWFHYLYRADLVVTPLADYHSADDIGLIVAHAFYTVTGLYPTAVSAAPSGDVAIDVAAPGSETVAAIGAGVRTAGEAATQTIATIYGDIKGAAVGVTEKAQTDFLLLVVGIVALLALIIWAIAEGPQTGRNVGGILPAVG